MRRDCSVLEDTRDAPRPRQVAPRLPGDTDVTDSDAAALERNQRDSSDIEASAPADTSEGVSRLTGAAPMSDLTLPPPGRVMHGLLEAAAEFFSKLAAVPWPSPEAASTIQAANETLQQLLRCPVCGDAPPILLIDVKRQGAPHSRSHFCSAGGGGLRMLGPGTVFNLRNFKFLGHSLDKKTQTAFNALEIEMRKWLSYGRTLEFRQAFSQTFKGMVPRAAQKKTQAKAFTAWCDAFAAQLELLSEQRDSFNTVALLGLEIAKSVLGYQGVVSAVALAAFPVAEILVQMLVVASGVDLDELNRVVIDRGNEIKASDFVDMWVQRKPAGAGGQTFDKPIDRLLKLDFPAEPLLALRLEQIQQLVELRAVHLRPLFAPPFLKGTANPSEFLLTALGTKTLQLIVALLISEDAVSSVCDRSPSLDPAGALGFTVPSDVFVSGVQTCTGVVRVAPLPCLADEKDEKKESAAALGDGFLCGKTFDEDTRFSSTISAICGHGILVACGFIPDPESLRTIANLVQMRFPTPPALVVYDAACLLRRFVDKRDLVGYWRRVAIVSNKSHVKETTGAHTLCGAGAKLTATSDTPIFDGLNGEAVEHANNEFRALLGSIRTMNHFNAIIALLGAVRSHRENFDASLASKSSMRQRRRAVSDALHDQMAFVQKLSFEDLVNMRLVQRVTQSETVAQSEPMDE
eukprot:a844115_116.p1 GENE.a844115_116~~a844115_116.p1  ORF type:complete len:705 (+),score=119.73 a844115_116:47-2116(+)